MAIRRAGRHEWRSRGRTYVGIPDNGEVYIITWTDLAKAYPRRGYLSLRIAGGAL
jgi:hypothetical protein